MDTTTGSRLTKRHRRGQRKAAGPHGSRTKRASRFRRISTASTHRFTPEVSIGIHNKLLRRGHPIFAFDEPDDAGQHPLGLPVRSCSDPDVCGANAPSNTRRGLTRLGREPPPRNHRSVCFFGVGARRPKYRG